MARKIGFGDGGGRRRRDPSLRSFWRGPRRIGGGPRLRRIAPGRVSPGSPEREAARAAERAAREERGARREAAARERAAQASGSEGPSDARSPWTSAPPPSRVTPSGRSVSSGAGGAAAQSAPAAVDPARFRQRFRVAGFALMALGLVTGVGLPLLILGGFMAFRPQFADWAFKVWSENQSRS